MSNSRDWFQELYDTNKETFFKLLQVANKRNTILRLSVDPDGTVIFSANDDGITKTIMQDQDSITYRQYHQFNKGQLDGE